MSSADSPKCSCEENNRKMMAPLLASISLDAIPPYASRIRQCHENSASTIACEVLSPPLSGSYHVVFQLEFTDGLRWIIKIPVTGYRDRYDEITARALKSEALTMRFLKRETTIPIPEVYSFDASLDNELNCPYILMEFIQGTKLSAGWFKQSSPLVSIEQFRANALKDIAAAMVQLNKFSYKQSGSLVFDEDGNVTGVGPAKVVHGPAWSESLDNDDCDDSSFFFENGPFDDPRLCFLSALERHDEPDMSASDGKFDKGIAALIQLFINWVPFEKNSHDFGFVLKHPDLDIQNILVSEDGHLCGIIDWDGVAASPRYTGCEQYPLCLTCDWNPFSYDYQGPGSDNSDLSPEELAYYRSMYAGFMDLCFANKEGKSATQIQQGTASAEPCFGTPRHFTRGSLLVQSLELASIYPIFTLNIIDKLFGLIEGITASEYDSSGLEDDMEDTNRSESGSDGTTATSDTADSDEEKTSVMAHLIGEPDILAHQLSNEGEDSNDLSSSLLMKPAMITSNRVHHDKEDDTVAHQSSNDGVDDDSPIPLFLSTFNQLSDNAEDQSSSMNLANYLLNQIKNTTRHGSSTDVEAGARKIDELLVFVFGHQLLQDIRAKVEEHQDIILRSVATVVDNFKTKVIPSRSRYYSLDETHEPSVIPSQTKHSNLNNTDELSYETNSSDSEESLKKVDEDIEKCDVDDSASAVSESAQNNQEDMMGHCDSTDKSMHVGQEDTGDTVQKTNVPFKDSGFFTLWEITHLLADGTLDEDRMGRLKKGFLALLASLEDEKAVPTIGAGTGTA